MSAFELDAKGWQNRLADDERTAPDPEPSPDLFEGTARSVGAGVMRGGARVGQFLGMLGAVPLALAEKSLGTEGTLTDTYFKDLNEVANDAVDFWTPDPHTLGAGARALGGLSEIALPLAATGGNPALLIGSQEAGTATDLTREGVDPTTAVGAGVIQGAATAAGFKVPILGNTLLQRMAAGAAGNVVVNAGATEVQHQLLEQRGYDQLAANYNPLDGEARAVDVLSGLVFGALHHAVTPSHVAAVATVNNGKHFQTDTAPGIAKNEAATIAHTEAMERATEQLIRGEPVSVPQEVLNAEFTPRPDRELPIPAEYHALDAELAAHVLPEAKPIPVPHEDIAALAVPDEVKGSLRQAYEKAAFVKPFFDDSVRAIARDIGATDEPLIPKKLKGAERAAEKTVADYAGDASKVKDLVRATVVVRSAEQLAAAIEAAKARFGEPTKLRNTLDAKVETPDGYRDVNMNFNVDGHTVELQVNFPEMLAAKEKAHVPYEERRSIEAEMKKTGKVSPEQLARVNELDKQMQAAYAAAWKEALSRSNASLESGSPSSRGSLKETGLPPGTSKARTSAPPPSVGTTETGTPSQSKNLGRFSKKAMTGSSGDILRPEGGSEPAEISAVRQLLAESDMTIPTGEVDADGQMVTRSAREIMAEADADIAKAENDAKGFEAATSCFLTRGPDAS